MGRLLGDGLDLRGGYLDVELATAGIVPHLALDGRINAIPAGAETVTVSAVPHCAHS
jgi:hypothetical protein